MMIFTGSRYIGVEVTNPLDAQGTTPRVLGLRVIPPTPGALEHLVVEGARLDQLAFQFYSEPTRYWLILDANPEVLNPLELLTPGRRIRIPRDRIVSSP
jgi:nucleoid-associated protein YgaU